MLVIFLFINFFYVSATSIEFFILRTSSVNTINLNGGEISDRYLSLFTNNINKITYSGTDEQINIVANLPELRVFNLEGQKQLFVPTFQNLPKIESLSLDRNELFSVQRDSFRTIPVVYLHLQKNSISQIQDGSFGTNLKHIYLACNMLQSIESVWFQNPAKIEVLDFDANNITFIRPYALQSFTALSYLYLLHNNLKTISIGVMPNRNFFSELWLGYNSLTELNPSIFAEGNITVEWLDISFNKLSFLTPEFMERIHPVDTPLIDGNPWQCPCYYYQIIRWMPWASYGIIPKDRPGEPRCVADSGAFATTCVPVVNLELIDYFMKHTTPGPENKEIYCRKGRKRAF